MKKRVLKNGLTIIHQPTKGDTASIVCSVHVGSNNESPKLAGASHFLEHMIFEGTKTRTAQQIAEEIEKVGGDFNAYTSNERTVFYIKVPKKFFLSGLEVLSDIILNSQFTLQSFNKEKKVVLSEIDMVGDQPTHYQWILFEKTLYEKIPTKNPVHGTKKTIKAMTLQQVEGYYKKHYIPNNMTICVVGDIPNAINKIAAKLSAAKKGKVPTLKKIKEPKQTKVKVVKENKKNKQSYIIMGYKTVSRLHKDSYALDIIKAIFAKGLSGRIVEAIRQKRGLAYQASCEHEAMKDYGFIAVYFSTSKKNVETCRRLVMEEITKLQNVTQKELKEAKDYIEGSELLEYEDPTREGDEIAFWEFHKDAKLQQQYLKTIRKVTLADIKKTAKKYLTKNYTMIMLE